MTNLENRETQPGVRCRIGNGTLFEIWSARPLQFFWLPDTVTFHQGWKMYDQFPDLKEIHVSREHPVYRSVDGALYSRRGQELLYVPLGKSTLRLPADVQRIGHLALNRPELTEVTVEEGNPFFRVVDGCLYDMDMENLYFVPCNRRSLHIPRTLKYLVHGVEAGIFGQITVEEGNPVFSLRDGVLYWHGKLAYVPVTAEKVYISEETLDLSLLDRCECLQSITIDPKNPWLWSSGQLVFSKKDGNLRFIPPLARRAVFPEQAVLAPGRLNRCRNLREVEVHRNTNYSAGSFRGLHAECELYVNLGDGRKLKLPRVNPTAMAAAIGFLKGKPLELKPGTETFFLDAWLAGMVSDTRDRHSFRVSAWQILKVLTEQNDTGRMESLLNQPGLVTGRSVKKALCLARSLGYGQAQALLEARLE